MRCMIAILAGVSAACMAWAPAFSQPASPPALGGAAPGAPGYGSQAADPCAPVPNAGGGFSFGGIGSAIGMLGNLAGQAQRQQACAAQRQAQWDAYQAKLKAEADQKQPATAPASRAPASVAAAPTQAPPPPRQATSPARRAAPARVRLAEAASQSHADALAMAENSADNACREPAVARAVMAAWNGIDRFKARGVTVIDIEHLTTSTAERSAQAYTCHGVYVTNQGDRVMGSVTIRHNVVGDPIAIWTRDADQELSHYRPPARGLFDSGSTVTAQASRL